MLTNEQVDFYQENGYVLVEGLLSPEEAAQYRQETHDLATRLAEKNRAQDATWKSAQEVSGGVQTQLKHCHDVQFFSAAFSRLIVDERLVGPASQCIGSENVQLHHTKMFIKPPEKGSPFPMHQDHPYFPHDNHSMIAAIIHFDDAPLEKGCVRVVPGSHKMGPVQHEGNFHLPFDQYPLESAVPLPSKAGDVLFSSYLTIHGSGINESSEARTTLLVQMRDPADKPSVDTHKSRGQGMILRGIDPLTEEENLPETVGAMGTNGSMGMMQIEVAEFN